MTKIPTPEELDANQLLKVLPQVEAQIEIIVEAMKAGKTECGTIRLPPKVFRDEVLPHVIARMDTRGWNITHESRDGEGRLTWRRKAVTSLFDAVMYMPTTYPPLPRWLCVSPR